MSPLPTILLVDDDPSIRASLIFSLELEGFSVRPFGDAETLLASGDLPKEACLVLDYRLPGMDGLQLLTSLRSRGVTLPAVIITSTPAQKLRGNIVRAGATLVEKPLLRDELTSAVRAAFDEQRLAA